MSLATAEVENPTENEPVSHEIADLTRAIEQSKSEIAERTSAAEAKKRPGGRPPGSRDKKPRKKVGQTVMQTQKTDVDADGVHSVEAVADPLAGYQPSPFLSMMVFAVQTPFANYAAKTGCADIKITDEEARAVALEFDKALYVWMPDLMRMDPKVAVLISAGAAVGGLAFSKAMIYENWKQTQQARRESEKQTMPQAQPGVSPFPTEVATAKNDGSAPALGPNSIDGFNAMFQQPQ